MIKSEVYPTPTQSVLIITYSLLCGDLDYSQYILVQRSSMEKDRPSDQVRMFLTYQIMNCVYSPPEVVALCPR